MSEVGKYLMAVSSVTLIAGFVIWLRMHRLPHIAWGLFDCYGLFITVTLAVMTASIVLMATRS